MPVTVVVGGQFGSEGKGKVAFEFARRYRATVAVRVGGSNSGHTVIDSAGKARIFRQLPTAVLLPDIKCVLPAGSYIDPEVLLAEITAVGLSNDRLVIDDNAVLITERERIEEARSGLVENIGSTGSGTGAAVLRRIARNGTVRFAGSDERLRPFIGDTRAVMRAQLIRAERVIIEGTQGFGLSILHTAEYPKATSRDTSAAGFVSEAGLSPLDVDQVVLVLRSHPIRVAGESGKLPLEINWDIVTKEAGSKHPIEERTTVTRNVRRVGRFDAEVVRAAIEVNTPTHIVMNHMDYVDEGCAQVNGLTPRAKEFVSCVESQTGERITDFGFGRKSLVQRSVVL